MVFDVKFNSELNALEYYNLSDINVDFDKIPSVLLDKAW